MTRAKNKGPMITVHGMPMRALPDGILMNHRDALSEEVLFWRDQIQKRETLISHKHAELEKAEATIRNQDVELRRLRARIAELESGPADGVRTRIAQIESLIS